ncbi:MAG TPA: CPBP family glutamic-type intramembrane protease [Nitrospira sp.]|nr:CPBP family glutamic-type intramembrane protease [Nitrospira sp.]
MQPEPRRAAASADERGASLALLPIAATLYYYALPSSLQDRTLMQFTPQIIAYLACLLWATQNRDLITRFGLERRLWPRGLRLGALVGFGLGCLNSIVILYLVPFLGLDIGFLRDTPHASLPVLLMVPWFITVIAIFVEFNFRGFLLGRLLTLGACWLGTRRPLLVSGLATAITALIFTFDPFMTNTFRHLHWIAVWDGAIWAACWIATRNLYVPITAHAVEVIVMYSAVRTALM